MNELYADVFGRCYGMETIGLRYFNVFGPRQDPDGAYAAVIPKWIAALLRNETVYINGDGETARDFCYVENVVQANLLAATSTNPESVNQVYNVAVGGQTSLNELHAILCSLLARHDPAFEHAPPVYRDFRPGDVRFSRADISKIARLLGYEPTHSAGRGGAGACDRLVREQARARAGGGVAPRRAGSHECLAALDSLAPELDNAGMKQRPVRVRVSRPGEPAPEAPCWEGSTPESRISAVWELTLQCLAWRGAGEPRLQRSVVRIQRARR
jgi:hypothetical protein